MIKDKARKQTEKKLVQMEQKIDKIYKQSEKTITENWNAYMKRSNAKIANIQLKYQKILQKGSPEEIRAIKDELQTALTNQTLRNNQYRSMVNITAEKITHTNEIALAYVNDQMPEIYGINYNAVAGQIGNISFNLVDESTVKYMITKNPKLIPYKTIAHKKDYLYNLKKINSSVLQGILLGESIPKISKRLLPIVDNNKASAIRNARTMTTSAENKGRFDSYKQLEKDGVVLEKKWSATGDDRTRQSHLDIDGESVPINEEFSNGLEYPADPNGSAEEVWNCRCSMGVNIIGFRRADGSISKVNYKNDEKSLHEQEIEAERNRRT